MNRVKSAYNYNMLKTYCCSIKIYNGIKNEEYRMCILSNSMIGGL
ncbi:hypothetical protein [uncultured Eubacterium sp.]|nr:hypothetical protein [uncultured Eubacterium sp.]